MTTAAPTSLPGILIVHGWDSDQAHYQIRAEDLAALSCVCLTFALRGHGQREDVKATVCRHDNLRDVLAAFDLLARQTTLDPDAMALIGTSHGGYLAAIDLVPREGIASYVRALQSAKSITHRMIEGADHGLSDVRSQRTYDGLLSAWLTEMIFGARTPSQR